MQAEAAEKKATATLAAASLLAEIAVQMVKTTTALLRTEQGRYKG